MKKRLDLVGQRFNKLVVTEFAGLDKNRNSRWKCKCDCGRETVYTGSNLKSGRMKGCGCELRGRRVKDLVKDHPDFKCFSAMLDRCYTPSCANYHNYGGRGITVCDRWRDGGFKVFLADMGARPTPHHSIDRIDNNKGYSPENCRWATKTQQARNKRTSRLITYCGVTATITEWAEKVGFTPQCISSRISMGMSVEEALTTPRRKTRYG